MGKKLKIQFWRAKLALAMQILEQEGLPQQKENGEVRILGAPQLCDDRIFLRGTAKWDDLKIAHTHIEFNTQYDLNAYLHWAVNAITAELFTGEGELKVGEICEVWLSEYSEWNVRKLLAILPENYERRFIAANSYHPDRYEPFSAARPITERTEPTVEECGQLITYTWEEK